MDAVVDQPAPLPLSVAHDVKIISHYTDKKRAVSPGRPDHQPGQTGINDLPAEQPCIQTPARAAWQTPPILIARLRSTGGDAAVRSDQLGGPEQHAWFMDHLAKQNAAISCVLSPSSLGRNNQCRRTLRCRIASVSINNQQALFTGKVQNDMSAGLIAGEVVAVVRQKSSGEIVATGSQPLGHHRLSCSGTGPGILVRSAVACELDPASLDTEISAPWGSSPIKKEKFPHNQNDIIVEARLH